MSIVSSQIVRNHDRGNGSLSVHEITDEANRVFDYVDGDLIYKVRTASSILVGEKAGTFDAKGYRVVRLFNKQYKEHRVIFLMFNGFFPKFIDHIDNVKSNNKIENLRACTKSENSLNTLIRATNKSGVKGVCRHKPSGKWRAYIMLNYKQKHLGLFDDINEAESAVMAYREKVSPEFYNHGVALCL